MVVNAVALSPMAVPAACGSTRAPNRVVISTFKQDALMIMEASRMLRAGCERDQDMQARQRRVLDNRIARSLNNGCINIFFFQLSRREVRTLNEVALELKRVRKER